MMRSMSGFKKISPQFESSTRQIHGLLSIRRRNESNFRNPEPRFALISPVVVAQLGQASWQTVEASRRIAVVSKVPTPRTRRTSAPRHGRRQEPTIWGGAPRLLPRAPKVAGTSNPGDHRDVVLPVAAQAAAAGRD